MTVLTQKPRSRTSIVFRKAAPAARWLRDNQHRVINVVVAHNRIIVNHWVR